MAIATNPSTNGRGAVGGLARANLKIDGGVTIPCWFNPKDYTISKQNEWTVKAVVGTGLPTAQFGGGQARELTLDLLFDASDDPTRSVADICAELFRAMEVQPDTAAEANKNSGRPPTITFVWGTTVSFRAVLRQLTVQYLLFRGDGSPIRAQAKLTLVQVEPARDATQHASQSALRAPAQNPTTTGIPGLRAHVLGEGDSLHSVAYRCYGDATRWRAIAEANAIDDPMRLPPRGTALAIPRLES